jgi:hypothetical protein
MPPTVRGVETGDRADERARPTGVRSEISPLDRA